ncbi:MAG: hypothetical protein B7Z20_04075 [Sphingobium sp. 32-64-5]|nr:MAG: hypothetical protein B7Z20_04075 [Sphingobium sp. 32-64-5]
MTGKKVQALHAAFADLGQALDSRDAARMLAAGEAVRRACDAVREQAPGEMGAEGRAALENLLPLVDEARRRINVEADDVRQRIALLAQQGVSGAAATYAR